MASMEPTLTTNTWPVIGHDWAVDLLRRAATTGRPPHALLITGPPSVGKGTLTASLAQTLLCTSEQRPCGACRACLLVADRRHPDLLWIEPQGASLKIAQVRDLTHQLSMAPIEGPWQIAVLDHFELATAGAANALLKTLEEPPRNVVLVLLAQQGESLLPTIVSRCQVIALRPIARTLIKQALIERWNVPAERAEFLSHICGGRIGWAIAASRHPQMLDTRTQKLDDMVQLLRAKRVERFTYVESLSRQGSESISESLELWSGWWRDVLLLTCGSPIPLTNIDRQPELEHIAARCTLDTTRTTLTALKTTTDQLSRNANARLALEVLLLDLPYVSE
jgi:DNA polymerase-3 subunit delta'